MEARRKAMEAHRDLQVMPLEQSGEDTNPTAVLQEEMQKVQCALDELDKER